MKRYLLEKLQLLIHKFKNEFRKYKYIRKSNVKILSNVQLDNPNIIFGKNVKIYSGVQIWGTGKIVIGDNVAIGKDTIIFSNQNIYIGSDTLIAAQCYIIDSDHNFNNSTLIRDQNLESKNVYIGEDVWIGAASIVLKGSIINDGTVIGANSVVNSTTTPYSINVGSPIKEIKFRSEVI